MLKMDHTDSIEGQRDEKNENMFHSVDYGNFYRSAVIGIITEVWWGIGS